MTTIMISESPSPWDCGSARRDMRDVRNHAEIFREIWCPNDGGAQLSA